MEGFCQECDQVDDSDHPFEKLDESSHPFGESSLKPEGNDASSLDQDDEDGKDNINGGEDSSEESYHSDKQDDEGSKGNINGGDDSSEESDSEWTTDNDGLNVFIVVFHFLLLTKHIQRLVIRSLCQQRLSRLSWQLKSLCLCNLRFRTNPQEGFPTAGFSSSLARKGVKFSCQIG